MKKKTILNFLTFILILFLFSQKVISSENEIYEKIDVFGEVLEKINKEYVDEINQSDSMDSAINGLLQSLDPYSGYMSPEIFNEMQTETSGEFGGLGIEVTMESGVVKVISPIDDTPASKAGIKAGDYIVKINDTQVQGKSLSEAVELMRGPVGSSIELTIRRRGEKKALTFNVTRDIIQIKSSGTIFNYSETLPVVPNPSERRRAQEAPNPPDTKRCFALNSIIYVTLLESIRFDSLVHGNWGMGRGGGQFLCRLRCTSLL